MFDSHWNHKASGVPALISCIISFMSDRIKGKYSTWIHTRNFKKCGKGVRIGSGFFCHYPGNIEVEESVIIGQRVKFCSEVQNSSQIGQDTFIGDNCEFDFSGGITIGKRCTFSRFVYLNTHDHGLLPRSKPVTSPLVIGDDVWIGIRAVILPSVHSIGEGSVIGAMSVVTKDVPPHVVVAGNPAKIIRQIAEDSEKE